MAGQTGLYILQRAARAAHILAASETFQPGEASDALDVANGMLDAWSAQRLMIYAIARQVFALSSGIQTYQMGTTAPLNAWDFQVARPSKIENVGVLNLANPNQPLELALDMLTKDQWAEISVKAIQTPGTQNWVAGSGIQSALPQKVYDDSNFPNRNLSFWPVPNTGNLQVAIYTWQAVAAIALATSYTFPPGYYECLVLNLAIALAAEWPGEVTPTLQARAANAMKIVKTQNSVPVDLKCDPALNNPKVRAYNWLSDQPVSH